MAFSANQAVGLRHAVARALSSWSRAAGATDCSLSRRAALLQLLATSILADNSHSRPSKGPVIAAASGSSIEQCFGGIPG